MTGLVKLLNAAAGNGSNDLVLLDESTHRWVAHVGLAPLLCHLIQNQPRYKQAVTLPPTLVSADMAARVAVADYLDSLEEILATSADIAQDITLLKGISACLHLYPQAYLRSMGDIDLLVPKNTQGPLEALLLSLGYRQQSTRPAEFYKTHHHSMPFVHPQKQTWVEVHTALLSNSEVATDRIFSLSQIQSQIVPITFRGHRTNRLSVEQELIYLATHWALERKCFAGGVMPFVDMLYLLRKHGHEFDWDRLVIWLKDSPAAVYVNLMLGFLVKNGIVSLPSELLTKLAAAQKYPLGASESILYKLIDNYSMRGRRSGAITSEANLSILWETLLLPRPAWENLLTAPWNILFVPENPRRFSPAFQFSRISRMLGLRKLL